MGAMRALVPPDLRLPDMPAETDNGWTLAIAASEGRYGLSNLDRLTKDLSSLMAKDFASKEKPKPAGPDLSKLLSEWPKEPTAEHIAQAEEALKPYAGRIRFLEAAVARPVWAMPRYADGYRPRIDEFREDFSGLSGFRALAKMLTLRANVHLAKNQPDAAVADVALIRRTGVRLAGGYGGVLPHLVGSAVASIATAAALKVAYHPSAGEFQVAALKRLWQEEPVPSNLPNALRHEFDFEMLRTVAATNTDVVEMPVASAAFRREIKRQNLFDRPATVDYASKYLRLALGNRDRQWAQRLKVEPNSENEPPVPPGFGEPQEGKRLTKRQETIILDYLRKNPNPVGRQLADISAGTYDTLEESERRQDAINRMAITAFALRLAALRDGKLPPAMDALVASGLLPAIPSDPFAKGSIRYDPARRVLWSVGIDGKDDGGKGRSFTMTPDVVIALP